MKAVIEIEFSVDGKAPDPETLNSAVWKMVSAAGYIGSEEVDGTDEWGLEIGEITISVFDANVERTHGARLESEEKEIKGLKHRCCDAACSESSFWDDEFVEWNRIIRAEGLNPCALTRDQTVWALRKLLDWTHDRIQGKCPQKTELSREGCLLRASVIEGWIEALSEKPHLFSPD